MATLYVENVPDKLYQALRSQARSRGKSIAAEIVAILEVTVVTHEELKNRQRLFQRAKQMRARKPLASGPFPSAEEMVREDRRR